MLRESSVVDHTGAVYRNNSNQSIDRKTVQERNYRLMHRETQRQSKLDRVRLSNKTRPMPRALEVRNLGSSVPLIM
jgi:hypothetical protein